MANRYWIGGAGSWYDTSHWSETSGGVSGAAMPTKDDDVFFDANSLSVDSEVSTTPSPPVPYYLSLELFLECRSIDFTGTPYILTFKLDCCLVVYNDITLTDNVVISCIETTSPTDIVNGNLDRAIFISNTSNLITSGVQLPTIVVFDVQPFFNIYSYGSTFLLPLVSSGEYDFYVNWGDGTLNHITDYNDPNKFHIFSMPYYHCIQITGIIKGWSTYLNIQCNNITNIFNWGCFSFTNTFGHFFGNTIEITATDIPDLSDTTSFSYSFAGTINTIPGISAWNMSNVTDMSYMFYYNLWFNDDISSWDVSNVTDMSGMFYGVRSFNQDISSWDTSNVTDMSYMFYVDYDSAFNQPIGSWDTSNVTDMSYMFYGGSYFLGSAFDQDVSSWSVSAVTDMSDMFTSSLLSTTNYENILVGWSVQNVQSNVPFSAGLAQYHSTYADEKAILTGKGWTITDGGEIT